MYIYIHMYIYIMHICMYVMQVDTQPQLKVY